MDSEADADKSLSEVISVPQRTDVYNDLSCVFDNRLSFYFVQGQQQENRFLFTEASSNTIKSYIHLIIIK